MSKLNISKIILIIILLITSFNTFILVRGCKVEKAVQQPVKHIEQKKGYWVEEVPDFEKLKLEIIKGE